jgi:hypothetical protein
VSAERSRVLLLTFARRGEEAAVREAVRALAREFPEACVTAVGTPVSADKLRALGADEVIVFDEGSGARGVIRATRSLHAVGTMIIYGGPGTCGHLKLEALALLASGGRLFRYPPEGRVAPVGRAGLLCSAAVKLVRAGLCLMVGAIVCGLAFPHLRAAQVLAGGRRARRN